MMCHHASLLLLQAEVRGAHEGSVWSFAWHPAGHVLATGAADATTKFWCRARPGDAWRDRGQREQEEGAASEAGAGRGFLGFQGLGSVMHT